MTLGFEVSTTEIDKPLAFDELNSRVNNAYNNYGDAVPFPYLELGSTVS